MCRTVLVKQPEVEHRVGAAGVGRRLEVAPRGAGVAREAARAAKRERAEAGAAGREAARGGGGEEQARLGRVARDVRAAVVHVPLRKFCC